MNAFVGAFVEELAACGVREVCLCPGSRSTPLALLLRRHPDLRVWSHLDERCASFFALGMARATGRPVAVLTTSGTAAANLLPAITEAHHGRVPLLALTADRPHELRDVGALQTIDQVRLFGSRVKWAVDMPLPSSCEDSTGHARAVACRAVERSLVEPAGPVHVNFPFREPLSPSWQALTPRPRPRVLSTAGRMALDDHELDRLAEQLHAARQPLVVCGPQDDQSFPPAAIGLAEAIRAPLLADVLSQVRCGEHHRPVVLDAFDWLLRIPSAAALRPDLVLRFGSLPVSKPLQRYLARLADVRQIVVDVAEERADPLLVASQVVRADATRLCRDLVRDLEARPTAAAEPGWLERWQELDHRARTTMSDALRSVETPSEPRVFLELADLLPRGSTVFVGNSMPVRDLDAVFPGGDWPVTFLANRGASGIDGVVSSALGAAAATTGPLVLVLGDLSFYHDMNGLLAARRFGLSATIVVINNNGGGVFSFLPQAEQAPHFEELFATPHGLDFRHSAGLYGLPYELATTWSKFRSAVGRSIAGPGVGLVEVKTDRAANADLHRDLWAAVAAEIAAK